MILLWIGCTNSVVVLSFGDEHNYQFSSSIEANSTEIIAEQDAVVQWGDLDRSLVGYEIDPQTDIEKLSILHFPRLSEEEILLGISNESLKQSDLSEYAEYYPSSGETQSNLTAFSFQGTHVDPIEHLEADTGNFLLSTVSFGGDTQMLCFFYTNPEGENTEIEITSNSAKLSYEIDLISPEKISSTQAKRYVVDWSNVTSSGTGKPIQSGQIDTMMLASFSNSLGELEDNFLLLPSLANDLYEADVFGKTAIDIGEIGFTEFGDQLWLFVLRCRLCINPAPIFVGVIQP